MAFDLTTSAALILLCSWPAARYLLKHYPRGYFAAQSVAFACLTLLLRNFGIDPIHQTSVADDKDLHRWLIAAIQMAWWLIGAWLVRAFLRVFVRLGSGHREATLLQEILGALIYLVAVIAILTYVLDLPIKGLLATSGALAIVVGLALQSSLGDVFSGIVLNLECPYRAGDWIVVDGTVQGEVIETNWRTTHIRTGANDLAIVPNSVIAKSKIVNCSQPGRTHSASVSVCLRLPLAPEAAIDLMKDVLQGSTRIVQTAAPSVTIKDITAEFIEYELGFSVSDVNAVDDAKADLLLRVLYAAKVVGGRFASPLPAASCCARDTGTPRPGSLESIPLFDTLTEEELAGLLDQMSQHLHPAGTVVATKGTTLQSLFIVGRGVLIVWEDDHGEAIESARLSPGFYVGEMGLLTGQSLGGDITALTPTVLYEISKASLAPVLKARPAVAEQLGETLELREHARKRALTQHHPVAAVDFSIAGRVTDTIRHLFGLQ